MIIISNASPLIYLGKLRELRLIKNLSDNLITSDLVKKEVLNENMVEYAILQKFFMNSIEIKNPNQKYLTKIEGLARIDHGEESVIALALEMKQNNPVLVLDDKVARIVAKSLSINYTGTIGLILRNAKKQIITVSKAISILNNLVEKTPFRLSISLYVSVRNKLENLIE